MERIARLLAEPDLRALRESRKQNEKLILLLEKQRNSERCGNPETDKQIEKLRRQVEIQARNEARLAKRAAAQKEQADKA